MENLEDLKKERKEVMNEIKEYRKMLKEREDKLNDLEDKIARIEGAPKDLKEIEVDARNITKNLKKRERPDKGYYNEEQEERNKKRIKRNKISQENFQEKETMEINVEMENNYIEENVEMEQEDTNGRKREKIKEKRKLDKFVEELNMIVDKRNLDKIIEQEEKVDNEQRIGTEDLVIQLKEIEVTMKITRKTNQIEILKRYNYAESFRIRVRKEMEKDISEQKARMIIYKEISEKLDGNYENLRKMTQQAEKLYRIIKETGGRQIIRNLKMTNMSTLLKLTKKQILYLVEKLERE